MIETLAKKTCPAYSSVVACALWINVKVLFLFLLPIKFGKLRKYNE